MQQIKQKPSKWSTLKKIFKKFKKENYRITPICIYRYMFTYMFTYIYIYIYIYMPSIIWNIAFLCI